MAEHTPGPWHAQRYLHHEHEKTWAGTITGAEGQEVYAGPFAFRSLRGTTSEEAAANARLIAAAPDLLEACEAAVKESLLPMANHAGRSCHHCAFIEGHHENCIFGRLAAVIAKAHGDTQ